MNDDVWSAIWESQPDIPRILHEERTLRWKAIEDCVTRRFGSMQGLRVIEVGAGHGTNALHFAKRGASVTVLDAELAALAGAQAAAAALGVAIEVVQADLFRPGDALTGQFDVSCSFGLCEHFVGTARLEVVRAHLAFLRPGGVAAIGVPNRWAVPYRVWMGVLKRRGSWQFGLEVPFTASELERLVAEAGGRAVATSYGSFPATVVNYLVSPVLHKLGRRGLLPAEWRTPLDRMAYELLVMAERRE